MKKCQFCEIMNVGIKELEKVLEKKTYALEAAHRRIEAQGKEIQIVHKLYEKELRKSQNNTQKKALKMLRKMLKDIEEELRA